MEKFHHWLGSYWCLLTVRRWGELVILNDVTPDRPTLYPGNLTHTSGQATGIRLNGGRKKERKKEIKGLISKLGMKG